MEGKNFDLGNVNDGQEQSKVEEAKGKIGFKDARLTALVHSFIDEFKDDDRELVQGMLSRPTSEMGGNAQFDKVVHAWWGQHFGFPFTNGQKRKEVLAELSGEADSDKTTQEPNKEVIPSGESKVKGIKKKAFNDERFKRLIERNIGEFPAEAHDFLLQVLSGASLTQQQNVRLDKLIEEWWKSHFGFNYSKSLKRKEVLGKLYREEITSEEKLRLSEIRNRIKSYTSTSEGGKIKFINDLNVARVEATNNTREQSIEAANAVYTGLLKTLDAIAGASLLNLQRDQAIWVSSEILKGLDPLTSVCRGLADNTIPLVQNEEKEAEKARMRDKVYAYIAREVTLNGVSFSAIEVMIRPQQYRKPVDLDIPADAGIKIHEKADPRLAIYAFPKDMPEGYVHIRIDDHFFSEPKLMYDIEIKPRKKNLMVKSVFKDLPEIDTGQVEGHHFESEVDIKQLNVSFGDILEAFNDKIAAHVARQAESSQSEFAQEGVDNTGESS